MEVVQQEMIVSLALIPDQILLNQEPVVTLRKMPAPISLLFRRGGNYTGKTDTDGALKPVIPGTNLGAQVNGGTLFKGEDINPLISKTRDIFATRDYIISDSADRWEQILNGIETGSGVWTMTGYVHGGYSDFRLKQSWLNIGYLQNTEQGAWWGIGTELYRGHSSARDYRDDFRMWGINLLAGNSFSGGALLDGMQA